MVSLLTLELQEKVLSFRGGCIKQCYSRWVALTSDSEILETVSGLPITLTGDLPESNAFQYPFGIEEQNFTSAEIHRLLSKRIIVRSHHEPGELISPIFIREKSDGDGFRMILNLKKLNKVSEYEHFKMDTLKSVLNLIMPGIYMAKLDIKDAYYSVPIKDKDQKLLKFVYEGVLYKFVVLPNGYTKGPRKFTKLLKPILAELRKQGITLAAYLDDIIVLGWSWADCRQKILTVLRTLQEFGFVIHPTKCIIDPDTRMEFLGFIIDSIAMRVTLPLHKKTALKSLCADVLERNKVSHLNCGEQNTIRSVARLLGKISSSFISVSEGKMHYRKLEKAKTFALSCQKGKYDRPIALPGGAIKELLWWRDNIMISWAPITRGNPDLVISTDACLTGWGATKDGISTGGMFSEAEKGTSRDKTHINILEAKAVLFGLKSLCDNSFAKHIKILSDNTATVGALNNMGSSKSWDLDEAVTNIWDWALHKENWITASHIPGVLNVEADLESRKAESRTEWMLNRDIFQYVTNEFCFFPVMDLFASRLNNQLQRFASFRPDPEAEIIDSFTVSWSDIDFYAFPPFICIGRVIQKINMDGATGILIVPDWPNQVWYNTYLQMLIVEVVLPPRDDMLQLPSNGEARHPMHKTLRLRAGLVTGIGSCHTQHHQQ